MSAINTRRNKLQVDFRYRGVRCREQTLLTDTPSNRKKLRKLLDRIEAEILLDSFDYAMYFPNSPKVTQFDALTKVIEATKSGVPKFTVFAEIWFSECEVGWRYSHRETVRRDLNLYLLPEFGDEYIDRILKTDVLRFRASLGQKTRPNGKVGLSTSRINRIIGPLKMILREAADRFDFPSQVQGIKTLKVPRSNVDPFSLQEVQRILANVRSDFRSYYTVRFLTGMRTGEIDGLKWKYVDFERRQILIRESFVMGKMDYTKNDQSQREISMSTPVVEALLEQREHNKTSEFVFCNGEGNQLNYRNVSKRVWHPLLRYLDLPARKPYQTRHTAATLWLAAGENPEWIARQMGHANTEMLFRIYSRYVPNLTRQDGSAFEELLHERFSASDASLLQNIEPDGGADDV